MDDREAEAEFRRYSAEVDYRIHQIQTDRTERRLAYVQALYPNTLTAKAAFQEAAGVAVVALLFLVLPGLGLMWLDQPDGFDDPPWVWITYAAGLVVVCIVQCSRAYQAARAQFDVIQRTWARFNADGWPPLTEIEQAAHKETTPERLLELANSTNLDVLIVVGASRTSRPRASSCLRNTRTGWCASGPHGTPGHQQLHERGYSTTRMTVFGTQLGSTPESHRESQTL